MKQVWFFHGGESFSDYSTYLTHLKARNIDYDRLKNQKKWRTWIAEQIPEVDCLIPTLPNGDNAVYDEWKIIFEKFIPFFSDDVQLVGHSLGAMFLAKYLHEKRLEAPVRRIILVAPGYDKDNLEDYGSFKVDSAKGVELSAQEIHLFHSKDDPAVPFSELAKFQSDIPSAIAHVFQDRGHFVDSTFPELLEVINKK